MYILKLTFESFWVGKDTLSVFKLFQIKVSLLKNAKKLKKFLKVRGFFIKNLEKYIWLMGQKENS